MSEENFASVYEWATTKGEAEASAKSKASRINRSKKAVTIDMPGTLSVVSGMVVNLTGFRPGMSGRYKIVKVSHTISRSGWVTRFDAEGA